jgi:hypothetical protein
VAKVFIVLEDITEGGERGFTAQVATPADEGFLEGALTLAQAVSLRVLEALRDDQIKIHPSDVVDPDTMN